MASAEPQDMPDEQEPDALRLTRNMGDRGPSLAERLSDRLDRLSQCGVESWPLMTIYDELLIETPEDHGETIEASLEDVMDNVLMDKDTGAALCRVPIKSDGKKFTIKLHPGLNPVK